MNKKNKNLIEAGPSLLKLAGTQTAGAGFTGYALISLAMLLRLIPDEGELDTKWWKRILRYQMKGEVISLFTPALKGLKGEMPKVQDFVTATPYVHAYEILSTLIDVAKGVLAKTGVRRKGSSPIEQTILYRKFPLKNTLDLVKNSNVFVGSVLKSYTNFKNPYNDLQKDIKKWEKAYLQSSITTSADIKTASPMSPYNDAVRTSFNESENHKETAERLIDKFEAHYILYLESGKSHKEAERLALQECQSTLKNLCPLSIGTDKKGRALNVSKDEEFILFLTKKAIDQIDKGIIKTNDPLVHVNKLFKAVDEWKAKSDSVSSNLSYLLRKKYSNQDNIQQLLKIRQVNLEELGFTVGSNGKVMLDPRIKKALDDFKKSRK